MLPTICLKDLYIRGGCFYGSRYIKNPITPHDFSASSAKKGAERKEVAPQANNDTFYLALCLIRAIFYKSQRR